MGGPVVSVLTVGVLPGVLPEVGLKVGGGDVTSNVRVGVLPEVGLRVGEGVVGEDVGGGILLLSSAVEESPKFTPDAYVIPSLISLHSNADCVSDFNDDLLFLNVVDDFRSQSLVLFKSC